MTTYTEALRKYDYDMDFKTYDRHVGERPYPYNCPKCGRLVNVRGEDMEDVRYFDGVCPSCLDEPDAHPAPPPGQGQGGGG